MIIGVLKKMADGLCKEVYPTVRCLIHPTREAGL